MRDQLGDAPPDLQVGSISCRLHRNRRPRCQSHTTARQPVSVVDRLLRPERRAERVISNGYARNIRAIPGAQQCSSSRATPGPSSAPGVDVCPANAMFVLVMDDAIRLAESLAIARPVGPLCRNSPGFARFCCHGDGQQRIDNPPCDRNPYVASEFQAMRMLRGRIDQRRGESRRCAPRRTGALDTSDTGVWAP